MSKRIAIIGAGPGGYVAAIRAAQMGAEVTLIEKSNVGGTCLNHGCIPSKVLKRTADLLEDIKRAGEFGIENCHTPHCNMSSLIKRKEKVISAQAGGILSLLKKHRVKYITGHAYIPKANHLEVTDSNSKTTTYQWDKLILATGSRPATIPSLPFDGQTTLSSDDALDLQIIPESITIVGAGVIGCEFAFIWNTLGAKVTLVEAMDRVLPLPSVDEECSKLIAREMKKRKINLQVNRTVQSTVKEGEKLTLSFGPSPFGVNLREKDREVTSGQTDKLIVCIGRKPNSEELGLENIGVETDVGGWVKTDAMLRTSAKDVYAIGDLLGPARVMLAHVASTEGEIAVENSLGAEKTMQYDQIPGAIFTMPEIGNIGLSEKEAREKFKNVRGDSVLFRTSGKAQVLGEIAGQAKIVSDADTGKILGVHIAGPHATDLLGEAGIAMHMGAGVEDIAKTIHAHPTLAEVLLETSFKALDLPLHG
ncbi:MAG: dihydrolipoyl dehydrogenase [Desulfobulbaceae bacterium S5133MH15]|nr:MAG: dihydrolipoyl dehydrogenase [Desulfobulbaceae bacterium S5133MH15]OEU83460.1 MAG: dihydrolipoyl dehydrogenase [Desulfobulbaceae bacterium C00003063]